MLGWQFGKLFSKREQIIFIPFFGIDRAIFAKSATGKPRLKIKYFLFPSWSIFINHVLLALCYYSQSRDKLDYSFTAFGLKGPGTEDIAVILFLLSLIFFITSLIICILLIYAEYYNY